MKTRIKVDMKPVDTILTRLGVNKTGDVQMQLTRIVNKRITRYMPFRTGALSTKLKYISSPTEITVMAPYARYQYYGKVMVDPETGSTYAPKGGTKVVTDKNLVFNTSGHNQAKSHWFEASKAENLDKWLRVADKAVKNGL